MFMQIWEAWAGNVWEMPLMWSYTECKETRELEMTGFIKKFGRF